jgi:hypothetical protein
MPHTLNSPTFLWDCPFNLAHGVSGIPISSEVSRDWGGLLLISVEICKVHYIPATYLFVFILMSSSHVKFNIYMLCQYRFYVSLLPGGGRSGGEIGAPKKIRQNVAPARTSPPGPAGAALVCVHASRCNSGGRPRPAGALFPRVTLLLGGVRRECNAG